MTTKFEADGKTFCIGKLNAFDQLFVARKMAPALPVIDGLVREENANKDLGLLMVIALGQLSDSASDDVLLKCLGCVTVVQSADGKMAKLINSNGDLMFEDVSMDSIVKIAAKVIEVNLGNFFRTALSGLEAEAKVLS